MWDLPVDVRWDPSRSHRGRTQVDVWSGGRLEAADVEILDGQVTEKWATDVRASLTLSVPPTREWLGWLDLPSLELRVYSGLSWGRTEYMCPLGVFPVLPPPRSLPAVAVPINADDRWQIIRQNDLLYYWQGPPGKASALAARLMRESGLDDEVVVTVTKDVQSPGLMWDKSRQDLIEGYLDPIGAIAYVDRTGQAVIEDRVGTPGRDLTDGADGTVVTITSTKDLSKVINAIGVTSSKTDVDLPPVTLEISDPKHPAHKSKVGGVRSTRYSSPLIANYGDAYNAAVAQLAKLSQPALAWTVECVPDPTREPGDLITVTTDLGPVKAVVQSVTHPLVVDGDKPQRITLGAA